MGHYRLVVGCFDDRSVVIVELGDLIRGHEDLVIVLADPVIGGHHLGSDVCYRADISGVDDGLAAGSLQNDALFSGRFSGLFGRFRCCSGDFRGALLRYCGQACLYILRCNNVTSAEYWGYDR